MNTICLLLKNNNFRLLIKEMLTEQYQINDAFDAIPVQSFDLCITDELMFHRLAEKFGELKNADPDIFLPVLLISEHRKPDHFIRKWWEVIDDIVETPIEDSILNLRIKVLLRARNQSMQSSLKNDVLIEIQSRLKLGMITEKISFFEIDLHSGAIELSSEWKNQLGCSDVVVNDLEELMKHIHPEDIQSFKMN